MTEQSSGKANWFIVLRTFIWVRYPVWLEIFHVCIENFMPMLMRLRQFCLVQRNQSSLEWRPHLQIRLIEISSMVMMIPTGLQQFFLLLVSWTAIIKVSTPIGRIKNQGHAPRTPLAAKGPILSLLRRDSNSIPFKRYRRIQCSCVHLALNEPWQSNSYFEYLQITV